VVDCAHGYVTGYSTVGYSKPCHSARQSQNLVHVGVLSEIKHRWDVDSATDAQNDENNYALDSATDAQNDVLVSVNCYMTGDICTTTILMQMCDQYLNVY